MKATLAIRLAKPEDVPQVLALQQGVPEAPSWSEAVYREFVQPPLGCIHKKVLLVATERERLCGFAAATSLASEAELESLAVDADSRRSGFGSALLDAVVGWATAQGGETLRLEVRAANISARDFYTSKGLRQMGLRRRYYREPDDDGVLMLKELTAGSST